MLQLIFLRVFFFQAEDGIRDFHVTGVQTCALPICASKTWPDRRFDQPLDTQMTSRESAGRRAARPAGRTGSPGQQARPRPGARPAAKRKATRTPKGVPFRIFAGVVVFFSIFLVVKLVQVQVVDGATYSHDEASEVRANVVLPASRGAIYDRAGDLLAASAPRSDVIA